MTTIATSIRHRWSSLHPGDRRAVAIGGALLLASLLTVYGLMPYLRSLDAAKAALAMERNLLQRETALLAQSRGFEVRFSAAELTLMEEAPRLFGGDAIVATAALATHVVRTAAASRVVVRRAEPSEAVFDEGLLALRVSVSAVSDFEGLLGFIHALERGDKLVRVEALSITTSRRIAGTRQEAVDEEVLGLVATVVGYGIDAQDMHTDGNEELSP